MVTRTSTRPRTLPPHGIFRKVAFLSDPENYPERTQSVEVIQTHMAWVFLTHHSAWKLKKPVRYPFLDFSTPEARHEDCIREVALNRRLAPDVYEGVYPLTMVEDRSLSLGRADGRPVDWLVKMRRLPEDLMLDRTIAAGEAAEREYRSIGILLGDFFTHCERMRLPVNTYQEKLRNAVLENTCELMRPAFELPHERVKETTGLLLESLEHLHRELGERVREHWIVDGHGDLRPEHVCLTTPPVIIDCIEFNRDFRILDAAMDLAFLLLECLRLGAPEAARSIENGYREEISDEMSNRLLRFYVSLQAQTRAKVALWHLDDHEIEGESRWKAKANSYLDLIPGIRNGTRNW